MEEAWNLKHNYVGSEHILLGLLRETEGVAAQVLMNAGLRLEKVRAEVQAIVGDYYFTRRQPTVNEISAETTNPYKSPEALDIYEQPPALSGQIPAWSRWLVFTSLVLAVLTFPTEVDFMAVAERTGDILSFLEMMAICLALILVPLVFFFWINGWRGVKVVKGRIIAIGIIVVLKLTLDTSFLVNYFSRSR